ncbi:MAG TPA: hypothetical protein VGN83_11950 [Falsiroseomonas sp.]|jgi:hypothetical protein|nr:hypothetical protein [Falsiroseomonas sp.]
MSYYDDINFDVDVYVDKDFYTDIDVDLDIEGWSADAGADATADGGSHNFYTSAEAYTDAYAEVGYSEASSLSVAAVDP